MFKKLDRHLLHEDSWIKFYKDDVRFKDNTVGTYTWVDRKSGVVVVVMDTLNKILLNKEFRYVINDYDWELPGGGIDKDETPEQAAIREVKEESGIALSSVEYLGTFYPLNSFNTEKVTAYLARTNTKTTTTRKTESSESIIEQTFFTPEEILHMIDTNQITDAMTANVTQIAIRTLVK